MARNRNKRPTGLPGIVTTQVNAEHVETKDLSFDSDTSASGDAVAPTHDEKVVKNCGNCAHYRAVNGEHGKCLRYPPVIITPGSVLTNDGARGIFPITLSVSVCGEHKHI
jgi:hypothetical protein